MKFAVVISVLSATWSQVIAYPLDKKMQERTFEEKIQTNNVFGRIQLPTAIKANYEIRVNGTLNTDHDAFTVWLPEKGRTEPCRIRHDFRQNKIYVTPSPSDTNPWQIYKILRKKRVTNFTLRLEARTMNDSEEYFEVTYEIIGYSEVLDLSCYVHFNDLSEIVFEEGLLSVNSIMFKFL